MTQKPVIMTVLNDAFAEYFRVLLFSIIKHNPGFDLPLVILYSETLSPLSTGEQEHIRAMYPNVTFEVIDEKPFARFFPVTPPRLHPALLKLDIFRPRGFDRVIFLDADMLCLGDLSGLFGLDVSFGASLAGKDREKKERMKNRFKFRLGFNTGVLTIGKKYLDGGMYRRLMHQKVKPCPTADQDILIRAFRWKRVWCLDHRYNYHAQFFWKGDESDVKILHYAGAKPLEQPREARMKIWFAYRDEMKGRER
jgi:lipopolysaccharide biosynthesis glycosyltransferase